MGVDKGRVAARLDSALVERGLASSREIAAGLIYEGKVLVNGSIASKAARHVKAGDRIEVISPPKYVSRGGLKLEGALSRFDIGVGGLRVLDVGSSTGGFTDCLLQHQARLVYAVDVGTNQLHEKMRRDPRVVSFERTNVRDFQDPEGLGFDLVVADVSFTSVRLLARDLVALTREGGQLVILVKPQFEVGHREASKGRGIIRDPALWKESLKMVAEEFLKQGVAVIALAVSEIRGTQGNVEFFYHLSKNSARAAADLEKLIDSEVDRVSGQSKGNTFDR